MGISKDFAIGGGEAFNKAMGSSRKRRDVDAADPSETVIRRGRRQSEGMPRPTGPGGMGPQEGMDKFKSGSNKAKDTMQKGAENMSNGGSGAGH